MFGAHSFSSYYMRLHHLCPGIPPPPLFPSSPLQILYVRDQLSSNKNSSGRHPVNETKLIAHEPKAKGAQKKKKKKEKKKNVRSTRNPAPSPERFASIYQR